MTTQAGNILHPRQCSHHPPPALLTEGSSQDVSRKSTWPELHHERQSFSCLGIHMFSPLLCLRSRLTGTAAELNNQAGKLTSCKDLVTLIFIQAAARQLFFSKVSPDEISKHQFSSSPGGSAPIPSCKVVLLNTNAVESLNGQTDKQPKLPNSMHQSLPKL